MKGQWGNIINFLTYLGAAMPILASGVLLFMATTPYSESKIIAEGAASGDRQKLLAAQAAAFDLGGKILGLALVLASAIFHSLNLVDLVIWGLIGAVFQVIVFYLFELITPFTVVREIPRGNVAVGIFSAFLSVATGLLLAALISY